MKQTVTQYEFYNAFKQTRPDNFTYEGLKLLWEYFENYEADTGDEIELDVIGICCEYSEASLSEIMEDYNIKVDIEGLDEDEATQKQFHEVREYLECHTVLVGEHGENFVFANNF